MNKHVKTEVFQCWIVSMFSGILGELKKKIKKNVQMLIMVQGHSRRHLFVYLIIDSFMLPQQAFFLGLQLVFSLGNHDCLSSLSCQTS